MMLGVDDLELTPRSQALFALQKTSTIDVSHDDDQEKGDEILQLQVGPSSPSPPSSQAREVRSPVALLVGKEIIDSVLIVATQHLARNRPEGEATCSNFEKILATEILDSIYGDAVKVAARQAHLAPAIVAREVVNDEFLAEVVRLAVLERGSGSKVRFPFLSFDLLVSSNLSTMVG